MRQKPPRRRSNCPIAFSLDLVGDRWTLLVLRDLVFARKRYFQEFLESDEKIASNILADRLKKLECAGFIRRDNDPEHGRRVVYTLTEKALDLVPTLVELVRWGAKYDPQSGAPAEMMTSIAEDRDAFIAAVQAQHKPR